ncbi:helix-turn-helix transcriptional regulator [Amycolatopsis sp. OK19-0408]|uniref:Helix-turn-helix transcriptional regulator n=1 Tax=Amycolatopsis iheyensis TaxID=2945988 RepID=A0A9X2NG40_9PSEU|nr:helix-turn-helix transcriptional regulator [Amycolatopsis iheyensis]MCR6486693.1 helix-turn-helix transcriptional regulator [Amycolatopsis iheyensis]
MPEVGPLLKHWRGSRRLSQLALATEAAVSVRHLSFVETGRANPSRAMVLKLAEVLDVPLRERNTLLLSAGFAPEYPESALDAPALAAVREALETMLAQQEPFPALVMDRGWDIRHTNTAARRFFAFLGSGRANLPGPANVLRRMFHPDGARPHVTNWPEVAEALVRRVRREAIGGVLDERAQRILDEVLDYPGVPPHLRELNTAAPVLPIVPIRYERSGRRFDYFSTVTTLGTPQDVTLQELRIECFFPMNDETRERAWELADLDGGAGENSVERR